MLSFTQAPFTGGLFYARPCSSHMIKDKIAVHILGNLHSKRLDSLYIIKKCINAGKKIKLVKNLSMVANGVGLDHIVYPGQNCNVRLCDKVNFQPEEQYPESHKVESEKLISIRRKTTKVLNKGGLEHRQ